MMKKLSAYKLTQLATIIFLLSATVANAQEPQKRNIQKQRAQKMQQANTAVNQQNGQPKNAKSKVKHVKIAYFTNQIGLNEKEAKDFWPIYESHQKRLRENHNKKENATEADEIMKLEQESLQIKKEMNEALNKVLSKEKINKLYSAEKEFRKMLFERMNRKNQQQKAPQ